MPATGSAPIAARGFGAGSSASKRKGGSPSRPSRKGRGCARPWMPSSPSKPPVGKAGAARRSRRAIPARRWTRALFSGPGACASSRADVLMLGGRPIAVSLSLLCGGTCFLLKTTYEEAFRGLAPGILLEDAILRAFLDEGFAEKLDSASLPGSVLEGLFADRERMADVAIATGPAISPRALAALVRQERIRQAALARAKSWYWTVFDRSSAIRGR
ncbi:MAG TPA: GNAT family N-acetyltransferase [Beijerinckiaceae bacterium]|nr:GNAT family N-acetyltransferase [Beijerinckiaceae bacterium]